MRVLSSVLPAAVPLLVPVLLLAVGCASTSSGAAASAAPAPTSGSISAGADAVVLPPAGASFDYQLGGSSPVPVGVEVVVRDSTDVPAADAYGICYVNGFQTQPGSDWPDDLLVHEEGRRLVDPGWPDEHLFDLSTDQGRRTIAARHQTTIDGCAEAGYLAVEFDNLDSFTRSGGAFGEDEAIAFARLLVEQAHTRGLAAAQKNMPEIGARGRDEVGYDFAIAEECVRFDECAAYTDVYGALVFDIEYTGELRGMPDAVCARSGGFDPAPSVIVRDYELVPAEDDAHVYIAC